MNFKQLAEYFNSELSFLYQEEEVRQLFHLAVEHVTNWNRGQLLMNKDQVLLPEQHNVYENILNELKQGRPLQHILAETWFYGLKFKVSGAVLIPRPETEELVDWILEVVAARPITHLLDIGTGSGCIAISLKSNLQTVEVSALDVSADALAIARENAALNSVQINFIQADILNYSNKAANDDNKNTHHDSVKSRATSTENQLEKYDLIVSNPPYIKEDERDEMHQNVLLYEPHLALFVSNENPLIFYAAIADFALNQLRSQGQLFFEINEYLGKETVDLLNHKGFKNIVLKKDMQGKDRMISCNLSV